MKWDTMGLSGHTSQKTALWRQWRIKSWQCRIAPMLGD